MKPAHIIAIILIAAFAGAAGGYLARPVAVTPQATTHQTASLGPVYDRVMASGTLHCGYLLWPAVLMKDPNTGQFSGPWYDVVQEMGKRLGLRSTGQRKSAPPTCSKG